jgi:hypothetical protein
MKESWRRRIILLMIQVIRELELSGRLASFGFPAGDNLQGTSSSKFSSSIFHQDKFTCLLCVHFNVKVFLMCWTSCS